MNTRRIVYAAAVAALYAGLTMALAPISYGAVQVRVSEALCILPFFFPWASWGLFVGCIIANLLSSLGILDVVFGSLATLIASLIIAALGKKGGTWAKIIAVPVPVIVNGIVIGGVISASAVEGNFFAGMISSGLTVAAGEAAVMLVLGLPLLFLLPGTAAYRYLREHDVR